MKKKPTVIQGYTLIERKQAGEVMVVVGHNPKAASPYVTWKAYEHSGFSSFENGNYFSTLQDAIGFWLFLRCSRFSSSAANAI